MSKIYLVSDIHVNHPENCEWIRKLSDHRDDILLVAGDVSHSIGQCEEYLVMLKHKFKEVFFTPGNHDIWISDDKFSNSIEKMDYLLTVLEQSGIRTKPAKIGSVWIVPLFSWYDGSLGLYDPLSEADHELMKGWSDQYYVKWVNSTGYQTLFDRNREFIESKISSDGSPVITLSHMVPRRELMPSQNYLRFKFLPHVSNSLFSHLQVAGSTILEDQIRQLGSCVHCYGHTHINWDRKLDGVRYVQNSLGYPKERAHWVEKEKLLFIGVY
ncbi:putative 3',5'-cyclic adenosine monophosphate phosphodiesterase CpdA [Blattamonas nauphoetae]|uniref:3',5'-cyclic adenosine monophosphate phosphodiesterase CpdA n=1 Tax=Blattamonas nauphoetae TaxID=2049346 RepID=A0ABQ9XDB2_9EUKA|nr:putative 3',5'-cyclic adenosine monophosphate phosphodiesterase CpdA [Blattamonas nauphoetae]